MTASITLPTPTITTPRAAYADRVGRSRKIGYEISRETQEDGSYKAEAVHVHVSHDKDRKRYTATAYRVRVASDAGSPFKSESYSPMDGLRLTTKEGVARFSKKGIEAFTEKVVTDMPLYLAVSDRLQSMFTGPNPVD